MKGNYSGELVLFSAITGAIAAPIKLIVHHVFMWTGLSSKFYDMLTAYLVHGHHRVKGIGEWIFGELGDIAIGALFGVFLGFWLKKSRPRYHWWIGLGYGFGIWFGSLSFGNLTKIIEKSMTDPWSLFAHLFAMLTYGVVFVFASKIWKPLRERVENNGTK
jgi:hypothetical protein